MALWGKQDNESSIPKYLNDVDAAKAVFVSKEEAVLKTNKDKGITGAGWWLVSEYTDSNGKPRYKAENLIAMTVANSVSGDAADDAKVADAEVTITINSNVQNEYYYDGNPAEFSIMAVASSGDVTYQWQTKAPTEGAQWVNIDGATSPEYSTTDTLTEADDNTSFRCILGTTSGAVKVISDEARARWD